MTAAKAEPNDLRMSGKEFDRIMGQALHVKPKSDSKPKGDGKTKKVRKKKASRK